MDRQADLERAGPPPQVQCPHCHNPIEDGDAKADPIVCPSCGSSFRIDRDRTLTWHGEPLRRLDKYELLEAVGQGSFGTVYRARDTLLDRIVAVKIPRLPRPATAEEEDRFLREARSVAQLRHAGIVPVHEVGRHEAVPYIVSDFVDGLTLADALTGRRFSFRDTAEIVGQVADA